MSLRDMCDNEPVTAMGGNHIHPSSGSKESNKNIIRLNRYFNLIPDIDLDSLSKKIEDSGLFRNHYRKMSFVCSPTINWREHTTMVTLEYIISKFFKEDYYKETTDVFIPKSSGEDKKLISRSLSYGKHYKRINKNNLMIVTVKVAANRSDDENINDIKYRKDLRRYENENMSISPTVEELEYVIELYGDKSNYYYNKILDMILKFDKLINDKKSTKTIRYFDLEYDYDNSYIRYDSILTENMISHVRYPMLKNEISLLETFVENRELIKTINSKSKMGVLLYGPPGTGKSTFAKYLSLKLKMDVYDIRFNFESMEEKRFRSKSTRDNPKNSIILIDELDLIIQNNYKDNEYNRDNSNNKRVQAIIKFIDSIGDGCIIIATTNNIDIIDDRLKRPGRFDIIKELNPVNSNSIDYILDTYDDIDKDEIYKLIQDKYNECITMAEIEDVIVTYKLNKLGLNKKSQLNLQEDYT